MEEERKKESMLAEGSIYRQNENERKSKESKEWQVASWIGTICSTTLNVTTNGPFQLMLECTVFVRRSLTGISRLTIIFFPNG